MTLGLAGLLASALARGNRTQIIVVALLALLLSFLTLAALLIFLLDVPVALQSVEGVARLGIRKAVAKNLSLGLLFSATFGIAGGTALKYALGNPQR
jgi:hypothetical protein